MLDLGALVVAAALAARATAHAVDGALLRLSGDDAGHVAAPLADGPAWPAAPDIDGVVRRNIFCSACRGQRPVERPGPATAPLSMRLLAIMYAGGRGQSVAVIKDERGAGGAYAGGSSIDAAVILAIGETSVLLRLPDGRTQSLRLLEGTVTVPPQPPSDPLVAELAAGIEPRGENRYGVRRATIESLLGKMDALPSQARVEPDLRNGTPTGFRLRDVKQNGVFAKLGLRDGDVISSVNGLATNGPDNALAIYASLRSVDHLSVGLERAGRRITAEYDIE